MEKTENRMRKYGLVGKDISYSFSPDYFGKKFEEYGLDDYEYHIFDLADISEFPALLASESDLYGLNVTIPYKEAIIPYLDVLDPVAKTLGAVNTICFEHGKTIGYNTDVIGFKKAIGSFLKPHDQNALVLGSGGASKAILYVLDKMGITTTLVSRKARKENLTYESLTTDQIKAHSIIINCTPLGTYPEVMAKPQLPYDGITRDHLLFDLVYNPEETSFLKAGKDAGARTSNGYAMLVEQAEASWRLWNSRNV